MGRDKFGAQVTVKTCLVRWHGCGDGTKWQRAGDRTLEAIADGKDLRQGPRGCRPGVDVLGMRGLVHA